MWDGYCEGHDLLGRWVGLMVEWYCRSCLVVWCRYVGRYGDITDDVRVSERVDFIGLALEGLGALYLCTYSLQKDVYDFLALRVLQLLVFQLGA